MEFIENKIFARSNDSDRRGADFGVVELNEQALARLRGPKARRSFLEQAVVSPEPRALERFIAFAAAQKEALTKLEARKDQARAAARNAVERVDKRVHLVADQPVVVEQAVSEATILIDDRQMSKALVRHLPQPVDDFVVRAACPNLGGHDGRE